VTLDWGEDMSAMNLMILGPPGAGKGTQANRLSDAFGLGHLSSGDLLRAERGQGSKLGDRVAGFMDSGALVPDEIMVEVILTRLPQSTGFILDGFPRTQAQAGSLDDSLAAENRQLDLVLLISVPDEEIVDRITGRRVSPSSGGVYHVKYRPPKQPGVCDIDGSALIQRPDDTEAVVRQRLVAFHAQTEPLQAYYRGRGILVGVDGTKSVDEVFEQLSRIVRERQVEASS